MKTITTIPRVIIAVLLFTNSACNTTDDDLNVNAENSSLEELMRENGNNPDESMPIIRPRNDVFVYTESNSDNNSIYIYKKTATGDLEFFDKTDTGGAGSGVALGSLSAVILASDNKYLYAVNPGSNSISSLRVNGNGTLTLRSVVPSGGILPTGLAIYNDILYVVNAGSSNINGFHLDPNGNLNPISGSLKSLSSTAANPGQISFSPNGRYLYVTEKATDKISTFAINNEGVAGDLNAIASVGKTPIGFDFGRDNVMVVANAERDASELSSATSYGGTEVGNLFSINGAVPNFQTSSCGAAVTRFGRYAFVSNSASDSLSSYYIADDGSLLPIEYRIKTGDGPREIIVAANNYSVYVLCSEDHTIRIYLRDELGKLIQMDKTDDLPYFASGLATTN